MTTTATTHRFPAVPELRSGPLSMPESPHSEDQALVERMLDGDLAAFETFGERYFRALWRFTIHRLEGDREGTAEVVQTALAKALSKLDTYRGEASLLTWLCACCRNEILMLFRSRRRAPERVELSEAVEPAAGTRRRAPEGEAALLARERATRVHLVLDSLPEGYARALEWKYVEKLTVRAIAERLQRTEKSVESLLGRARGAFRKAWDDLDGATS